MEEEAIALIDIDQALADIWEKAAATKQIRSSLFNLVIYTQADHRTLYMRHLVDRILDKFPCRIIHVEANPEAKEGALRISVEGKTRETGSSTIVCDQIHLFATGAALLRVPSLILPHLEPDLPIFLLWGEDPTKDTLILPALQPYATRLIFDSEAVADLASFSRTILQEIQRFHMDFVDLHWARIACWRHVLTQVFDSEDKVQALFDAKEVSLVYSIRSDGQNAYPMTQAFYLQSWLASRLGWDFASKAGENEQSVTRYRCKDHEVAFRITSKPEARLSSGTILSLRFRGDGFESVIERVEDQPSARVHVSTHRQCDVPIIVPLPSLLKGHGFMKEVFYLHTSQHYRWMLEELQKISGGR